MSPDLYTLAHKAIRLAVGDACVRIGAAEPATLHAALAPGAVALGELVDHARHEDDFIAPLLHRYLPDLGLDVRRQHEHLGASIDAVARQLDELATSADVAPGAP